MTEVAELTARLIAETAAFQQNMESADATVAQARAQIRELESAVVALKGVLDTVGTGDLPKIRDDAVEADAALKGVRDTAVEAAAAVKDVKLGPGQTATFVADAELMAGSLDRVQLKAAETKIALDALRGPNGAIPLGVTPSALPGQTAGPAGGTVGYYDQLARQQTADFQRLKDDLVLRDSAALDALRGSGGGIALDSGDFSRTIGGLEEYRDLQRQILDDQRSAGGGLVLPNAATSVVGGDEEYRRFREELLNSQRTASGAIALGPGQSNEDPGAAFRRTLEERIAAAGVTGDRAGALNYLRNRGISDAEGALSDAEHGGAGFGAGGRDGGGEFSNRGFLTGFLPGGQRASAATVTSLIGLGLATGPTLAPAAVGAAAGAAAGLSSLIGAALTLKLAFADITAASFKSQKAFDALTPVQQDFVQGLRNIDYGFVRPLEQLASQSTLPGLTAALKAAITPASTTVVRQGVSAFGGAIGGGAQELGSLFGSLSFAKEIGPVFQADAGYVRDFFGGITNLADVFVTLENAAIPLTNWMDKGVLAFTRYLDVSLKSAQASGALAGYFGKAQAALESLGGLVHSVGDAFGAFFGAVGFQNSLGVIQTFRDVFEGIAAIINQNKTVLRDFFAGAIASAQDVISLVRGLSSAFAPLLSAINAVARGLGGFRVIIDALIGYRLVSLLVSWAVGFTTVGAAGTVAAGEVGLFRGALIAVGGADVLAALAGVLGPLALIGAAAYGAAKGAEALSHWLGSTSFGKTVGLGDTPLPKGVSFSDVEQLQKDIASGKGLSAHDIAVQTALGTGAPLPSTKSGAGSSGSGSTAITTLPISLQQSLAQVANETGAKQAKDEKLVYGAIRAYYDTLLAVTVNPADRTAILNARAGYVNPGGTTPPPLGNTKSTVLPVDLQTAIDRTTSDVAAGGSKGPEVTALKNAIAYINGLKHKTDADYQERTSLYSQLASLTNTTAGGTPSGIALLPAGRQGSLTAAQTAAAGTSATAGSFNAQNLANQRALHAQDVAALVDINAQIAKQAAGTKELRALEAERLALTREEAGAQKQINEELKSQRQAAASAKIDKILGISADGSTPTPGATSLGTRERQILLADAKSHGIATAGLVNEPLSQLVKTLAGDNALPKSSQAALIKVNEAIRESILSGTKLSSEQSQKIQAILTQVNDTLKNTLGYGSNYRAPSAQALAEAVPGYSKLTHEQQVALIAGFAKKVGHGGTAPTGGAVAGVPLGPNGEPLTTPPGYTTPIPSGAPPLAVSHSQFGQGVTFGDVTIIIDGSKGNAKEIAAEVRSELLKTARRNPLQTKGPNAGRRLALN